MNLLTLSPYVFNTPLTWYSVIMLVGALIAYAVSNYFYKKEEESKKCPDLLFNTFLIAFPAGLLGGRIWYVLSEWDYYSNDPISILRVWEGGLAIQGGVVLGIAAGVLYVLYKLRKHGIKLSITRMMDIVIPNILIAQVIGRWGNFFNREVYGACVSKDKLSFLPEFMLEQMAGEGFYPWGSPRGPIACAVGEYAQPLFLYEGILNFIGFILITIVLRKWFTKRIDGTLSAFYMIWYGTIRACLEGLRNEQFIMRWGNLSQSIITSIAYIIIGTTFIVLLYLIRHVNKKLEAIPEENKTVVKIADYRVIPTYIFVFVYAASLVLIVLSGVLWNESFILAIGLLLVGLLLFVATMRFNFVNYVQNRLNSRAIVFDEENKKIKCYVYKFDGFKSMEIGITDIANISYKNYGLFSFAFLPSVESVGKIQINSYSLKGIVRIDSAYEKLMTYTKKDVVSDVK